jgi:hypothetical protein
MKYALVTIFLGVIASTTTQAQGAFKCIPNSIGPGGCDSIGPGGGLSIGLGGGLSIGPGGGRSLNAGRTWQQQRRDGSKGPEQ